jgi:hypothetical protein
LAGDLSQAGESGSHESIRNITLYEDGTLVDVSISGVFLIAENDPASGATKALHFVSKGAEGRSL